MNAREEEFLKRLRATFKVEAEEHLQAIATCLLELEKSPRIENQRSLIETAFRAAHSLKGAARAVNFGDVESICQSLEDVMAAWKRQEKAPTRNALDEIHKKLDLVSKLIVPGQRPEPARVSEQSPAADLEPPVSSLQPAPGDTVRIAVSKLDAQLLEAEEMLALKLIARRHKADLQELAGWVEEWKREWRKVQPDARALRKDASSPSGFSKLAEFFEWSNEYVKSLGNKVATLNHVADRDRLMVGKLVDDLLEDSKKLLMLPLATLGGFFPKLVRDLCRDQAKEADLIISGEEVEIDKRILEEMKDPLIHLLRNCVDHGIETPEQRLRLGKPARATIALAVTPIEGGKVELLVSDDGSGIDIDKVKESAEKGGLISAEQTRSISDTDALDLIFEADVSTSPMITALSGRGLGLAIVREKTEKLGGRVAIESKRNFGASVRITLPLALATFRGILVQASGQQFVIPTAQVERVGRCKLEEIRTIEGRETLSFDGRSVALARLEEILELPIERNKGDATATAPVVFLGTGDQRIAFVVEAVLDEQEVLVKQFGKPLSRVRNIAGATVLGSGRVAPVLNVSDLLKSAKKMGAAPRVRAPETQPEAEARPILVVEDSITSRILLKAILESAGYRVKTAVDGVEAFTALRAEPFDLVVSDVEMPRMNGFDLTAKIRADSKFSELPIVLVTALETREDRERGIEVGANAYLVKSSFDQSNLLEAVRSLI